MVLNSRLPNRIVLRSPDGLAQRFSNCPRFDVGFDEFFASLTPYMECTIRHVPIIDVPRACPIETPSRG